MTRSTTTSFVVRQFDAEPVIDLLDGLDGLPGDDPDAALLHLGAQMLAHVVVEAAQDVFAAIDQRHLGAEPVEDAGELDRDVAAALDQDALRQLLEMERLVRRDDMLEAGDIRAERGRRRRSRSGCAWRAPSRRVSTSRTVCASSSTARLLTIFTFGALEVGGVGQLRAARSRGPCWRSASASRSSARGTVQP